jgi:acyl carrier protein
MGLDGAEILIAVEERFGVRISDAEGLTCVTVGALYCLVISKLGQSSQMAGDPSGLPSAAVRDRLRPLLLPTIDRPDKLIQPEAKLEALLPASRRRAIWRKITKETGWELPALELSRGAFWLTVATPITAWIALVAWSGSELVALLGLVAVAPLALILRVASRPWARSFPMRLTTFEDLVDTIIAWNHEQLVTQDARWNHATAWLTLRGIISKQLGVAPNRITPDAAFVADLGMS